jgi:hypothetical protein
MMKTIATAAACALLFLCSGSLLADEPYLEEGVYIYDGSQPLSVDRHSTPTVVDWNNDGRKDLVIGQYTYGYIWLYLNQGTDLNPVFSGGSLIQSNGSPITTTYG